eukprot:5107588-Pyramimonas_sp.AAC.1
MATSVQRQVANAQVPTSKYVECIKKHMGDTTFSQFFVPSKLVSRPSHVTPDSVVKISPILDSFVQAGLDNMTMLPKRLEEALEQVVKTDDHPKDMSRTTFIGHLVTHFQNIMKFIRTLKYEDTTANMVRKCRKTGGFRRQLSGADSIVIQNILRNIKVSQADHMGFASGSEPATSPPPQLSPVRKPTRPRAPRSPQQESPALPSPSKSLIGENFFAKTSVCKGERRSPPARGFSLSLMQSSDEEDAAGGETEAPPRGSPPPQSTTPEPDALQDGKAGPVNFESPEAPHAEEPDAATPADEDYDENGVLRIHAVLMPNAERRKSCVLGPRARKNMKRRPAAATQGQGNLQTPEKPKGPPGGNRRRAAAAAPSKTPKIDPKTPKIDPKKTPKIDPKTPKIDKAAADTLNVPLERAALSGPTAEEKPRHELC